MKPGYSQNATNQRDRWMVSYVDVLTILLAFFLVGAAKSLDVSQARAMPTPPPSVAPVQVAPVKVERGPANLARARERLAELGLQPEFDPRGLVISLPQVVLFKSGEDKVSPQALTTIADIADVLRDIPNNVQLVGHADTVPVHNRRFRSNWDLSVARSHNILELLSNRYGIPESRLSFASYGPYRPAAPNDTADGRASNRRVEIVILEDANPERSQPGAADEQ